MEKEFVPPTESLALKELGFDEPCLAGRSTSSGSLEYYSRPLITNDSFTVDAPLYQQAFRWFRDEHGLDIDIAKNDKEMIDYVKDKNETYLPKYTYGYSIDNYVRVGSCMGYEEAELACLRKLIEIVKEK
jgi:hypothetical protein